MRARTIFFLSALAPLAGFNHLAFSKRKVSGEVPSFSQRPGFAVRTCLSSIATAQAYLTCAVASRASFGLWRCDRYCAQVCRPVRGLSLYHKCCGNRRSSAATSTSAAASGACATSGPGAAAAPGATASVCRRV
jgi:hypothetical protein